VCSEAGSKFCHFETNKISLKIKIKTQTCVFGVFVIKNKIVGELLFCILWRSYQNFYSVYYGSPLRTSILYITEVSQNFYSVYYGSPLRTSILYITEVLSELLFCILRKSSQNFYSVYYGSPIRHFF
jgi:hypothetical protein